MAKQNFGIYEKSLPRSLSLPEKLRLAKELGFDYFEISTDQTDEFQARMKESREYRRVLREAIWEYDMPIWTMCLSGTRSCPIGSLDPAVSGRGMELSVDSIHFAADIGLQIVQLMAYDEYFGEINEDTYSLFIENLGILAEEAASCGVMLAMENCDTVTMDNLEKGIRIVEAVNSPWLKIYPDIANLYATGMGNEEACRQYRLAADHIVATHVKDTVVGVVRDIAFGAGEVDFPLFFKTLGEMNFHGPMTLEFWDQNDGRAYETAAESLKFIKQHYNNSYKPVS